MGHCDSKYDIVVNTLKTYGIYKHLYGGPINDIGNIVSINGQIKIIYDILSNPYINIRRLRLIRYNIALLKRNLVKVKIFTNIGIYLLYFRIRLGPFYLRCQLEECIDKIISKNKENIKRSIYIFHFPNDIKWLICEYI